MSKEKCPVCGGRLMFGSTAALALVVQVEAALAVEHHGRPRRARSARLSRGGAQKADGAATSTPRGAAGELLIRQLHDHIHQIAHLRDTPPMSDLHEQVGEWLAQEPR